MTLPSRFGPDTVWLVTGCSSGIGQAIANKVYNAGHRIVATARNTDSLAYLPDGPSVLKLKLEVTSQEEITHSIEAALDKYGQINVVINNAGYGLMGDTEAITEADARHQMETNFWGPLHVTQEALRVFREVNPKGQGGTIVQISSMGGAVTAPGHAYYHASKFALEGLTKSITKELDPAWNIRLLLAAPGGVRTKYLGKSTNSPARHPAYNTPASGFNQLLQILDNVDQSFFCSPDDCAQVLFDVVVGQDQRPLPTRLLMGVDAVQATKADTEASLKEIEEWQDVSSRCSPAAAAGSAASEEVSSLVK